jgi:hypothetical protein
MILAPWIERAATCTALTPTLHVLVHCQDMLASTTEYYMLVSLITRPYTRFVVFAFVMAADARVEFVAAKVLDGDDVQW